MSLIVGLACLCLAIVAFFVLLLGCRAPRQPRWCGDFLVANVYVPLLIAVGVYGAADLIYFAVQLDGQALAPATLWGAAGVVAATLAAYKALRVRRTLDAYATQGTAATRDGDRPEPPARPPRPRLAA